RQRLEQGSVLVVVSEGHPGREQDQRQGLRGEHRREQHRDLLQQRDADQGRHHGPMATQDLGRHPDRRQSGQGQQPGGRHPAVGRPVVLLKDHQLAIAVGSNWFADAWTEQNRHWANAAQEASAVPLPTSTGQAPGSASTLGGWAVGISKVTKHPELSWGLLKIMESDDNQTYIANRAGFVPPSQKVAKSDGFLSFAPPFNKAFGDALPNSKLVPSEQEGYPAWVQGIGQATGQIATDPN